jgi:hypothetical protein
MFAYYLICFLFNKIREQESGIGSAQRQRAGRGEMAQIMSIHVSKCKNNNIK